MKEKDWRWAKRNDWEALILSGIYYVYSVMHSFSYTWCHIRTHTHKHTYTRTHT